jgi:hypothetical protein
MKFLKGLGIFIFSFLLFLSLSVFSIGFLLHSTLLNPDFVSRQVDRMDISTIARDVAEEQIGEELPAELDFLKEAVYNVIDEQEPWLKEQLNRAIDTGYDFFLDKTDKLEISVPLDTLKTDLKDSLWRELNKQLAVWLRDNIQSELKPYIEQNFQEYRKSLPPEFARLPDAQLKSYLDTYLRQISDQIKSTGKAPELSGLLETLIRPYFDEYYDEFAQGIPAELTTKDIPANVMEQLLLARKYIGYFQTGYYALIVFMILLAGLIFLINRNVRDTTRTLGIDLLVFGALDLVGVLLIKNINPVSFIPDIPASLETWLTGLSKDILSSVQIFSIAVLIIGIILLVVSFIVKPRAAED